MRTLSADEFGAWKGRVIDVRSPAEFAAERLPGAECVPLGTLTATAQGWNRDEPLLVMCKSGMRSRQGYDELVGAGFTNVTMLTGGIEACKKAGASVIFVRKTLPIIRQVMIVAGSLLLFGLALHQWEAWFLLLTWFVSLGLVFAGVTGYCPLAMLLERMPWNKVTDCKNACGCESSVQQG